MMIDSPPATRARQLITGLETLPRALRYLLKRSADVQCSCSACAPSTPTKASRVSTVPAGVTALFWYTHVYCRGAASASTLGLGVQEVQELENQQKLG